MVAILAAFAPLFSHCVWTKAQTLAVGSILATGPRTVCSVLRIMGLGQERHFTNYHRVLNRDAWSCLAAGQVLLGLILALIPRDWPIVLAADDTIERRGGRRLKARGCYRDAVRSSRGHLVRCFGLKWIVLTVLVPVPWSQRVWALPLLTTLSWPEGSGRRTGHKTSLDWTRQMVVHVRRWLPERELILVLDGGFAAVKLAHDCQRHQVAMVCRLRLDAALYDPPGPQPPSKRGPKPKKGQRQRRLIEWAGDRETPWERIEVDWYGGERKVMQVFSGPGLWYTRGQDPVAIRYVLARDLEGRFSSSKIGQHIEGLRSMDASPFRTMTFGHRVITGGSHAPEPSYPRPQPGPPIRRTAPASPPPVPGLQAQDHRQRPLVAPAGRRRSDHLAVRCLPTPERRPLRRDGAPGTAGHAARLRRTAAAAQRRTRRSSAQGAAHTPPAAGPRPDLDPLPRSAVPRPQRGLPWPGQERHQPLPRLRHRLRRPQGAALHRRPDRRDKGRTA